MAETSMSKAQKAVRDVFNVCPEVSGMCGRYTYRLAAAFTGKASGAQLKELVAGGDAKSAGFRSKLQQLGYTSKCVGTHMTLDKCRQWITSTKFNPGDIVIYYSTLDNPNDSSEAYGHAQFYSGTGWVTSVKNNYGSAFVYSSRKKQHCWELYYLPSPI